MSGRPATEQDDRGAAFGPIASAASGIDLSIIAPAHNEEDNISGLLDDVARAMCGQDIRFEMILVDDGSTDRTASVMAG